MCVCAWSAADALDHHSKQKSQKFYLIRQFNCRAHKCDPSKPIEIKAFEKCAICECDFIGCFKCADTPRRLDPNQTNENAFHRMARRGAVLNARARARKTNKRKSNTLAASAEKGVTNKHETQCFNTQYHRRSAHKNYKHTAHTNAM